MAWFWLGFFALVALLLVLDLGVLHRKASKPTIKSAALWTLAWVVVGLSFSGVVYLIYENNWLGVHLAGTPPGKGAGLDATITYVSAYLLEQALSVDNLFVIAVVFRNFRIPVEHQHRVLFWGILGAIVFRLVLLSGGAFVAHQLHWVFYIFGAYLIWQGIQLLPEEKEEEQKLGDRSVRLVRRFVPVTDGDYGGRFSVMIDGKRWLTTVAVCLVVVELTDIVFAMDSIPAVLSISRETFIIVTSNVFAILGLRSLYFVLAGALMKFRYLKLSLAVLLVFIGVKMIIHSWYEVPDVVTLGAIAVVLAIGVIASIIQTRREPPQPPIDPGSSLG
jgi:tellurite resistance protein TerC